MHVISSHSCLCTALILPDTGGMTVGLWDALTITRLLHPTNIPDLNSTSSIIAQLHTFHRVRKSHSGVINILAQALYELFSAGDDADMQVLRDACFAYFCLGGVHVRHPVGLLAGYACAGSCLCLRLSPSLHCAAHISAIPWSSLIQSPLTLLVHFFAVAFLGMFRLLFLTPLALLQPLLMPASTLAAAQSRSTPLYATLKASDVVLRTTAVAASMPVNAARGVKVILSAATVIFPLIWAELKLQSV